jgi:hypothetical protein
LVSFSETLIMFYLLFHTKLLATLLEVKGDSEGSAVTVSILIDKLIRVRYLPHLPVPALYKQIIQMYA